MDAPPASTGTGSAATGGGRCCRQQAALAEEAGQHGEFAGVQLAVAMISFEGLVREFGQAKKACRSTLPRLAGQGACACPTTTVRRQRRGRDASKASQFGPSTIKADPDGRAAGAQLGRICPFHASHTAPEARSLPPSAPRVHQRRRRSAHPHRGGDTGRSRPARRSRSSCACRSTRIARLQEQGWARLEAVALYARQPFDTQTDLVAEHHISCVPGLTSSGGLRPCAPPDVRRADGNCLHTSYHLARCRRRERQRFRAVSAKRGTGGVRRDRSSEGTLACCAGVTHFHHNASRDGSAG